MADEDIQCAAILDAVQQEVREQLKRPQIGFCLSLLIDPSGTIADASAKTADQELVVARNFQVQIGAAFCA